MPTFSIIIHYSGCFLIFFIFYLGRYSEGESRYNLSNVTIKEAVKVIYKNIL